MSALDASQDREGHEIDSGGRSESDDEFDQDSVAIGNLAAAARCGCLAAHRIPMRARRLRSGFVSLNEPINLTIGSQVKQMIETEIRPARQALAAGPGANTANSSKSRLAMRLWTLLHAQALLQGTTGGAAGGLDAEDDRWRLAARWETTCRR